MTTIQPTTHIPTTPIPQVQPRDKDGDHDNDATESASAKAKEISKPVNPNLGNIVNTNA